MVVIKAHVISKENAKSALDLSSSFEILLPSYRFLREIAISYSENKYRKVEIVKNPNANKWRIIYLVYIIIVSCSNLISLRKASAKKTKDAISIDKRLKSFSQPSHLQERL